MCVRLVAQSCPTLCDPTDCSPPEFSRLEYWSGLPCPPPGDLPDPGTEGLPHCRRIPYRLSHERSPRILEWVSLSLLQRIFLTHNALRDDTLQWMALIPCPCRTLLSPHSFLFLFLQGDSMYEHSLCRRKQTEQAQSWKQDTSLGWTVDFELSAQYLWKQHTNWKTRPPRKEEPQGSYLDSPLPKRIP